MVNKPKSAPSTVHRVFDFWRANESECKPGSPSGSFRNISTSALAAAVFYGSVTPILIYLNYSYFSFEEWKRLDLARNAIFWLIPVLCALLVLRIGQASNANSRHKVYLTLAFVFLSLLLLDQLLFISFSLAQTEPDRLPQLSARIALLTGIYLGAPLIANRVLAHKYRLFGFGTANIRQSAKLFFLASPFILVATYLASLNEQFLETYPVYRIWTRDSRGLLFFMLWELMYGLGFFATEFFFRGLFLHALRKHLDYSAVLVMMLFYVLIHFSKPAPECVAAMFGAVALGIISLKTRSIWFGVFCHVAIAWSMDLWAILRMP